MAKTMLEIRMNYTNALKQAEKLKAAEKYAEKIGLAFQIVDDILDVTSDSAILGKSTGKDERDSKATFVTLLGLDGAKARLDEEILSIKTILSGFEADGFDSADYATLADFLVNRDR